jgi:hypothetical protein
MLILRERSPTALAFALDENEQRVKPESRCSSMSLLT